MVNAVARWSDFRQIESLRRPLAHSAHTVCLWNAITLNATSKWWKASLSCQSPNECYWGKSSLMPSTNTEFLCKKKGLHLVFLLLAVGRDDYRTRNRCCIADMWTTHNALPARADLFPSTYHVRSARAAVSVSCSRTKQVHRPESTTYWLYPDFMSQHLLYDHTGGFGFNPLTTNCICSSCCRLSKV